jgi:hypothetical protein
MATYAETQAYIRYKHGFVLKTCWIAHVLADHGLTRGPAANRIDEKRRVAPCPPQKRATIEQALRALGRLPA